jgi:hypothetical protein
MKNFISSGRFQGKSLFFPITLFFVNAAIREMIMGLCKCKGRVWQLLPSQYQFVAPEKFLYGHSLLPLGLQFINAHPTIGTFDVQVVFIVGREGTGFCQRVVRGFAYAIDFKCFFVNDGPRCGIGA